MTSPIPKTLLDELNIILNEIDKRLTHEHFPDTLTVLLDEGILDTEPGEGDVIHIPTVFEVIDRSAGTPAEIAARIPDHKTREIHLSLPVLVTRDGAEVFRPDVIKETVQAMYDATDPDDPVVVPPFPSTTT